MVRRLQLAKHTAKRTAITKPSLTRAGNFLPRDRRPQRRFADSFVAVSIAIKGILLALRIVSTRDVAVMMCEEPEVKDVKRKTLPSLSHALRSCAEAMSAGVLSLGVLCS